MFTSKQDSLLTVPPKKNTSAFIKAATKETSKTLSGNNALKYSKTDDDFVTEFTNLANYRNPRNFTSISTSCSILWNLSPGMAMRLIIFIRLITRITLLPDGTKTSLVQKGQGLKHEGILRMIWLAVTFPDIFKKNIHLFISIGSWKDIFFMLSYDLQHHGWDKRVLDWDFLGKVILAGLENPQTSELVKKYLPQIKANSHCTTLKSQANNIIAKWICSLLFPPDNYSDKTTTYRKYRVIKSSGKAHEWQQHISRGDHKLVNFDTVAGRALALLVSSKYLENQGLTDRYTDWISQKPVAKFTGYVYELFSKYIAPNNGTRLPVLPIYKEITINKQFQQLVDIASKDSNNITSLIVVRDTSGSMNGTVPGMNVSPNIIAKSIALFLSKLLPEGKFHNSWIQFSKTAILHNWRGNAPVEMWRNDTTDTIGNTNFQSVIDLFCTIKKNQNVEESEFPTGIICISDGEFDKASIADKTNFEVALDKLKNCFSEDYVNNFQFIFWNIPNGYYGKKYGTDLETYESDTHNVLYFSGFDPSIITLLTGSKEKKTPSPKNMKELFDEAMNQEVMGLIEI